MPAPRVSRYELEVLQVLWRLGEASVRQVQEALAPARRPAYTTVQTILGRLEEKGAVRRTRKVGNALRFTAQLSRRSAFRRLVDELVDLFGGSQPLVAHLVEVGKLGLDDLRALEETLRAGPLPDTEERDKRPRRGKRS
jgi:BlaI family transcriptional regulator, penicillinase repressor